jgi:L-amino acid N-acyltransferase YncA
VKKEIMIRKAVFQDALRLSEINIFGWRCAYREIVSENILFSKLLVVNKVKQFEKSINEANENTLVYDDNGIIKGFMNFGKCRNEDKPNAYELYAIYVEPLMKRQGIGIRLLNYFDNVAIENGYKESVLWVFKQNCESRAFYEKNGYINDGKEEYLDNFKAWEIRYRKNYTD